FAGRPHLHGKECRLSRSCRDVRRGDALRRPLISRGTSQKRGEAMPRPYVPSTPPPLVGWPASLAAIALVLAATLSLAGTLVSVALTQDAAGLSHKHSAAQQASQYLPLKGLTCAHIFCQMIAVDKTVKAFEP